MSKQPKCPNCGCHAFTLVVEQLVEITFEPDDEHRITDGPRGDMEWDDDSLAICADCRDSNRMGDML